MTLDIRNGVLKKVYDCDTHVVIPDSVTSIGDSAFQGCTSLQSVSIPDSVEEIGDYAFDGCSSLQSVSIPDSVEEIGEDAFDGCDSLQSIRISPEHFFLANTSYDEEDGWECECDGNEPFTISFPLSAMLNAAEIIICIAPISDIPEEFQEQASLGFALHEEEYPEELREEYIDFIRDNICEMLYPAIEHPELLRLMCREKLIDQTLFPNLLDEALRREAVEAAALLLEYKHTVLN